MTRKRDTSPSGTVVVYAIEGLHRIFYTRKDPAIQKARLNGYRPGHSIVAELHCDNDLVRQYQALLGIYAHRSVVDENHQDAWFDLTPEDVQYIKRIGGEA